MVRLQVVPRQPLHAYPLQNHFLPLLPHILSLRLLESHEKVVKGLIAIVVPVVLNTCALQEAQLRHVLPFLLRVEGDVQGGHLRGRLEIDNAFG